MAFKLKETIDKSGRYKYKLQDYSLAFAAGRGVSPQEAKNIIQDDFEKEFGIGMKDYLDNTREQYKSHRKENLIENSRELGQSMSM